MLITEIQRCSYVGFFNLQTEQGQLFHLFPVIMLTEANQLHALATELANRYETGINLLINLSKRGIQVLPKS